MKKKNKNIYLFFIKMLLIFIGLDLIMMITSNILTSTALFAKYRVDLINEIFYSFAILIVLLLFRNQYVFTEKKKNFLGSITLGMPMIVLSVIMLLSNIFSLESFSFSNFINVIVLCIFIGIAEEFLCRGWIQNEFMERFSDDKRSVIKSIILSSLIFGVMHIVNLSSQNLFETLLQIINATALGMLLGSIYYKTKNIWAVIFLHSFYDFSLFMGEINLIKDCTYNTPTLGITIVNCLSIAFISSLWIFSSLKVLNKKDKKTGTFDKNKDSIYSIMIFISFVLLFLPIEQFVPNYDKYKVCYNYNEISDMEGYVEHFPHSDEITISSIIETKRFADDYSIKNPKEVVLEENIDISFVLDDYVYIRNKNTNYEVKLDIEEANRIELLENDEYYIIIIESLENEATIYYNKISKFDLRNSKDFIDFIKDSFIKYSLPELKEVGYLTFTLDDNKYPYFISVNDDRFIIKDESLYLIK